VKTRIHVNQHVIRSNKLHKRKDHPISIIQRGVTTRVSKVKIAGPCKVVYSPDKPLSCGARVWIETEGEVEF
jgi:hypothetical protein